VIAIRNSKSIPQQFLRSGQCMAFVISIHDSTSIPHQFLRSGLSTISMVNEAATIFVPKGLSIAAREMTGGWQQ
jgi:hypothetical protein